MLRPRVIPCLLIHKGGLVKTVGFDQHKYIGDPINAVRIFNEKKADEIIVLDIDATVQGKEPNFDFISKIAVECRMPLCYGGGVTSPDQVTQLVDLGVEKVAISSAAITNPSVIPKMSEAVGSQSIVAILDIFKTKNFFNEKYTIKTHNGKKSHNLDVESFIAELQKLGVGEIVLNSINRDGAMQGYDINLAAMAKNVARVPLTILGGAGSLDHIQELIDKVGLIGAAAGSLFVFKGKYKAVLINYPTTEQKINLFEKN